jgi:hypothetical protein
MTRFEAEYRERMVRALESDLFALRSRPTTAPGAKPEPTEVEIPDAVSPIVVEGDAPATPVSTSPPASSTNPSPAGAPPATSASEAAATSAATHEVDVRSLFEQAQERSAAESPSAFGASQPDESRPTASEGLQPIDLLGTDGADADVLDDDAFFATLRDAVHDDAPLGPRDENDVTGDHSFFDQDADRGSFRDVFRRRR